MAAKTNQQESNMNTDMEKEMIDDALQFTKESFDTFSLEKDIATSIKRSFEKKHKGAWHCVVGKNFGSFVTHEQKSYIYFLRKEWAVLLWKSCS
mmetsp:Transcript_73417/g.123700  ORF Transcript_73417/g.123700 Transcript_73417/m.123700 type:complete len:94 (+) Transcript_73417:116-397(+)|eukprot:CAMPEP_0174293186 /NCGR_PEP_ID=MMETSP0809-20121228/37780_1 /TAXON_ID=73025 ORGANISM="Eutreptiella gymnastica-like, Strain CCMP1594" /NCGR_SAMPLE_ID=MMETSP0809 /ASSEMBLY_ACC=CAM_ASM_000658 /LENGTH=93 /DNA_ID=CAMNT_0015393785 /DNA_START=117 /DNA_END=398 /DNA_ORIENTATION=+